MSRCPDPFDAQHAATSLMDELRHELKRQGYDQRAGEGLALDHLAQLLDCPHDAARSLMDGKGACARVICTLKARVAGGGGLKGARDQRAHEWQAIQRRQDQAMRELERTRHVWPRWSADVER